MTTTGKTANVRIPPQSQLPGDPALLERMRAARVDMAARPIETPAVAVDAEGSTSETEQAEVPGATPPCVKYGWEHPGTCRWPERVIVSALGPSRHDFQNVQTKHEAPMLDVCEVWGLNAGANWQSGRVSFDLLWVMDYLDGEVVKWPRYVEHLVEWARERDRSIMTSWPGNYSDVTIAYPLAEVQESIWRVAPQTDPYLHNSVPYLLAYAWWIGVREIQLWGVDYNHPSMPGRAEDKRANCEYWIGWCRAMGMRVMYPNSSTICDANEGQWFYGYPRDVDRHPRVVDWRVELAAQPTHLTSGGEA